jgi:uncharacterized membrane protein YesL
LIETERSDIEEGASLRGVRIVLKGLSDTLEHLLPFCLASLAWWLAVFTVVFAPGATLALFRVIDPRVTSELDRPSLRESADFARRSLARGWRLALVCLPIVAVLLWNLRYYSLGQSQVALLAPLWIMLLLTAIFMTATAFSAAALLDQPWRPALTYAAIQTGRQLPTVLVISAVLWPLFLLGGLLVVPVFMFLPATFAAVINRFLLASEGIAIPDPLFPTDERAVEEARGRDRHRFGP